MPLPELSRQEVRLGRFAAFCSALYGVLGLLFAVFPGWIFHTAGLGARAELTPEVRFWQVLGVAMMVAISVACALVAHSPRERRTALLPVLAGQLTSSGMALVLVAGARNHRGDRNRCHMARESRADRDPAGPARSRAGDPGPRRARR